MAQCHSASLASVRCCLSSMCAGMTATSTSLGGQREPTMPPCLAPSPRSCRGVPRPLQLPLCCAGEPIEARRCGAIGAAYLYATSPHMFAGASAAAFACVRNAAKLDLYGCDCYAYGLLAAGFVDLVSTSATNDVGFYRWPEDARLCAAGGRLRAPSERPKCSVA